LSAEIATPTAKDTSFTAVSGTTPSTLAGGAGNAVNPLDFGAMGDGATDDTAALNAAAIAATGKVLALPAGTYVVSSVISLFSGTVVRGAGSTTVISLASGDISAFQALGQSGVTVSDLKIFASRTGTTAYKAGILFQACTNSLVENVEMDGLSWAGVFLYNTSNTTVRDSRFYGWRGELQDSADVNISDDSSFNLVDGNTLVGGGDHGVLIQDPYTQSHPTGNKVTNNTIGQHKAYGVAVYVSTFYDTQTTIANNRIRDITGLGSTGTGAFGSGIYLQSSGGVRVIGNHISNCATRTKNFFTLAPAGIGVAAVSENDSPRSTEPGAPVSIIGNIITDMPTAPGIFVQGCNAGVSVQGNTIRNTATTAAHNERGIHISASSKVQVHGNTVITASTGFQAISSVAVAYTDGGAVRSVEKGRLVRAAGVVTATVRSHTYMVGDSVTLTIADVNFSGGSKKVTGVSAITFTYTEEGNRAESIVGGTFVGPPRYSVQANDDISISSNFVVAGAGGGIAVYPYLAERHNRLEVTGNSVTTRGGIALYLEKVVAATVAGNFMLSTGGTVIYATGVSQTRVSGNSLDSKNVTSGYGSILTGTGSDNRWGRDNVLDRVLENDTNSGFQTGVEGEAAPNTGACRQGDRAVHSAPAAVQPKGPDGSFRLRVLKARRVGEENLNLG
jgi:putative cofactor-binding repeat protein